MHPYLDTIDTVEKYEAIAGGRVGTFFCTTPGCGKKFPHIKKLANDVTTYTFRCNGCGQWKHIDAGMMALLKIKAVMKGT